MGAEQAITPIISRCHQESNGIIDRISPEEDSRQFAERLKTGNQPPLDFPFEECHPGDEPRQTNQSQYGTLGRKRSKLNLTVLLIESSSWSLPFTPSPENLLR